MLHADGVRQRIAAAGGAIRLFLWLCVALGVFYSGHLYSDDALTKLHSMNNFLSSGSFSVSPGIVWGRTGRDGVYYPQFSIGSIVNTAPAVLAYRGLLAIAPGGRIPEELMGALATLQSIVYTALAGVCIYLLLQASGAPPRSAFLWVNGIVFGSQMLSYSSTAWSEPGALLFGLLAFAALIVGKNDDHKGWLLWSLAAATASLIRMEYLAFFLLFLVVDTGVGRRLKVAHIWPAVFFGSVLFVHAAFNAYRFGSWSHIGYLEIQSVAGAPGTRSLGGIISAALSLDTLGYAWAFLLSFGKVHWFWVSPYLLLVPLVVVHRDRVPRRLWNLFLAALIYTPVHILMIGTTQLACTSWCWGFRYFHVVFPYLLLPVCFVLPNRQPGRKHRLALLSAVALVAGIVPAITNFHVVLENLASRHGYEPVMWERIHAPWQAPFWEHLRQLPSLGLNTLNLAFHRLPDTSWEHLRTTCLDIWPVGLSAMGLWPFAAFTLWGGNIVLALWWLRATLRVLPAASTDGRRWDIVDGNGDGSEGSADSNEPPKR